MHRLTLLLNSGAFTLRLLYLALRSSYVMFSCRQRSTRASCRGATPRVSRQLGVLMVRPTSRPARVVGGGHGGRVGRQQVRGGRSTTGHSAGPATLSC